MADAFLVLQFFFKYIDTRIESCTVAFNVTVKKATSR